MLMDQNQLLLIKMMLKRKSIKDYQKKSRKTTELYMKNKNKIKLSDSDLEQVGMMMLDDNKVDQAIDINKNLKSKKLGQK